MQLYCYGEQVGEFPVKSVYIRNLSNDRFYELQENVIADCDDHQIRLLPYSESTCTLLLKCSCESSKYHRERYDLYLESSYQHSNIVTKEKEKYCVHALTIKEELG